MNRRTPFATCAALSLLAAAACAPSPDPATAPSREAAASAATAREAPPAPGPRRPYEAPAVEEMRLDNGLRVVVVRQDAMPIVTARLLVDAGAAREPAERAGLATLTAQLLDEGTARLSGAEIAERMEQLGAEFSTGAGRDVAAVTVTALRGSFPAALSLAADVVRGAAFPEAEFVRARDEALAGYRQSLSSVEGLSSQIFDIVVFAEGAPYARRAAGTAATLQGITRGDVVGWHRRAYAPGGSTLLLVGDLTAEEGRRLAERAFGSWSVAAPELPAAPNEARPVEGTRIVLVDRPGSVQSGIRAGVASIGMADDELFRMLALSHVLGGGFAGRINMNLREEKGWTYGAFTNFDPRLDAGVFRVQSSVRTNATDSAVVEIVREFRRLRDEPVPEDELRRALDNLTGSFPNSVQTVQGLAGRVQDLLVYGLPLETLATWRESVDSVTPEDLLAVAGSGVDPDALTIVVAGDLSTIEAPIRALGIGTVEVWDEGGSRVR